MAVPRRQVLGVAATVLAPGCSSAVRSVPGDDDCTGGFHVSGERFDPATDLTLSLDADQHEIVAEAAETGTAERTTYGQEPLRGGVFVEHDGAFYETSVTTAGTDEVMAYRLSIEWEAGQRAPDDATVVAFSALPEVDREVLDLAVYGSDERREHPAESLSVTDFPAPYPDGAASSELVSGITWVRWNDRDYRIEVEGSTSQERRTFRYAVERVATDPEEFRTVVAADYLVNLAELPDGARDVVSQALDGGYEECAPASDALERVRSRLDDDQRLPHSADGWYVRFDGGKYRLSVREWVH